MNIKWVCPQCKVLLLCSSFYMGQTLSTNKLFVCASSYHWSWISTFWSSANRSHSATLTFMPIPSASSKIFWPCSNFFDCVQYFLNTFKIFWPWSKVIFYLINLHIWAWSKMFDHIQIYWTWSKKFERSQFCFWTSRWIRQQIPFWG